MKHFELFLRFPGSAPLVGGHAGDPGGAHVGHATDERGRPVLPSTAIRGALRATLEALCRGTGKPACTGGDGRPPAEPPAPAIDAAPGTTPEAAPDTTSDTAEREIDSPRCTLDDGDRCLPCRLFGSQRPSLDAGETAFSALVLGSAYLDTKDAGWHLRPGVAVSRTHRSAHEKALVFQRVPAGRDLCFVARGRLRDPALAGPFEAAVRATSHIGAGRSRGLGRVDMDLCWRKPDTAPAAAPAPDSMGRDVYVRAELKTPAALGVAVVERNFLDARAEIPGSTVRGAVGFALAELLPAVGDDPAFRALVAEAPDATSDGAGTGGAHFGFLYPVDGIGSASDAGDADTRPIIGPLPMTAQACKRERRAHGVRDTLLDRLTLALADTVERAERAEAKITHQCKVCDSPLRSIAGSRRASERPRTRAVTRVALDRCRGSARDEQLFTQMRIEAGTCFEGTIRNVPEVARERLAQALGSGLLSVGRGRAAGWGTLEITAMGPANGSGGPLRARGAAFEAALRQRLQACGMNTAPADRLVPVTLLAPLMPTREDDPDGARLLGDALGGHPWLRLRRFTREGGWDQQQGVMRMSWAVTAGSVFVIELPEGTRWHDIVPRLEALERDGVGARRHQGFGQVLCFDPFFLERATLASEAQRSSPSSHQPQESSHMNDDNEPPADLAQRLRPHRKALVEGAEAVMQRIADRMAEEARAGKSRAGKDKARAGKSQLHRLAAVCNQAECVEEIANYLRYQASRDSAESFWDIASVKDVLDEAEKRLVGLADDADKVAAWRLYAVYLMRAFTYHAERNKAREERDDDARRRDR